MVHSGYMPPGLNYFGYRTPRWRSSDTSSSVVSSCLITLTEQVEGETTYILPSRQILLKKTVTYIDLSYEFRV